MTETNTQTLRTSDPHRGLWLPLWTVLAMSEHAGAVALAQLVHWTEDADTIVRTAADWAAACALTRAQIGRILKQWRQQGLISTVTVPHHGGRATAITINRNALLELQADALRQLEELTGSLTEPQWVAQEDAMGRSQKCNGSLIEMQWVAHRNAMGRSRMCNPPDSEGGIAQEDAMGRSQKCNGSLIDVQPPGAGGEICNDVGGESCDLESPCINNLNIYNLDLSTLSDSVTTRISPPNPPSQHNVADIMAQIVADVTDTAERTE